MPAPTAAALRDFESQFLAALAAILAPYAGAPYSLQLATHEMTEVLTVPRLEYAFAMAEPAGPEGSIMVHPQTGAQLSFAGTFNFRHVYDHQHTAPADAGALRGALRTLLSPETGAFTESVLPWLRIEGLNELSSALGRFKDEREKLLSEWFSTWSVVFSIRPDAWPV